MWIGYWIMRGVRRFSCRALLCCIAIAWFAPALASDGSSAQHKAAEEMLAAMAAGDAMAMAQAIHPDELELLRKTLVEQMRLEADRNDSLLRGRLFGAGMPLSEIERLTPQNFFVTLAQRLRFGARAFENVDWLAAVSDSGGMVQMLGRSRPVKSMGTVRVPVVVSLLPWGKEWKAAIPLELQAQIDDLRNGRVKAPVAPAAPAATAAAAGSTTAPAAPVSGEPASPRALLDVLQAAEDNLRAVRCEDYYDKQMSPNFRRTTSAKALKALVSSCQSRAEVRERLLAAFQLARTRAPSFEYAGTRAVYDLHGQGLPFDSLVFELVDKRWYIAE